MDEREYILLLTMDSKCTTPPPTRHQGRECPGAPRGDVRRVRFPFNMGNTRQRLDFVDVEQADQLPSPRCQSPQNNVEE